jgi:ABC-type multidrug transport system ATPase subunit
MRNTERCCQLSATVRSHVWSWRRDSKADVFSCSHQMFQGKTLLCIAHRLQTVISMEKIAVVANGSVAEFDRPSALLENSHSRLSAMVDATGLDTARSLRQAAVDAA